LCLLLCTCLFGAQPNVVLIVADDLGWGDLGCYGSKQNSTPHVDRLAREGMKFESFYAAQAVCTSSRCALLTGCYPNRLGLGGTALPPASKVGLHPEEQTLATLLRAAGYRTGIVGKWHLGDHARFLPPAHGFDESLIVPYSNDMWPVGYFAGDTSRRKMYPELRWIVDGVPFGAIDDWTDMDNLTVMQGFRATKFIRDNAGAGRPFFLYLATSMPHTPLGASKDFKGKGPTPYAETLADLDDVVGYVLAALREKGVENDTIVIFTSDNGPWLNFGRHAGVTGGFREGKGTTWEGGVRVPCIVRWPNQVPRGVTTPALAANLDLLPTIVAACEVAGPRRPIDGQSFLSLLKGERLQARDVFPYYYGDKLEAIRQGRWKLHLPHTYRSYDDMKPAEHDGAPMKTQQKEIGFALFDLEADPGERTDVKEAHPEVVTRLKELAAKERAALDAGKRPVGRL
jgi:arylsulfatase